MGPQLNPLTDEHRMLADKVLQSVPMATDLARRCKECGLDMDDAIATLEDQQRRAAAIKHQFFPDYP